MDTFSVKAEKALPFFETPATSGGMQVTVCIKTKHPRAFIAVKGDFNFILTAFFVLCRFGENETLDLPYDK